MNYKNLSKVLKYSLVGEEELLKAIHESPDETNHKGYSDWLEEHDRPEDAEFHRNVGDWHQKLQMKKDDHELPYYIEPRHSDTPKGVSWRHIPYKSQVNNWNYTPNMYERGTEKDYDPIDYAHSRTPTLTYYNGVNQFRWKTYKDMLEAFHSAFKAEKRRQQRVGT